MSQLCQLKQVRGQAAHQLTGAVPVVKIKAELLKMPEQVCPNICFHPDAKGVTEIGDNELQCRTQQVTPDHSKNDDKKCAVHTVGQQII